MKRCGEKAWKIFLNELRASKNFEQGTYSRCVLDKNVSKSTVV
jgi:hypothetical protein